MAEYGPEHADRFSYERLACGCESWTQGGEFVCRPCALQCPAYLEMISHSRAQGNRIRYKTE